METPKKKYYSSFFPFLKHPKKSLKHKKEILQMLHKHHIQPEEMNISIKYFTSINYYTTKMVQFITPNVMYLKTFKQNQKTSQSMKKMKF
jgi:hypothetical protein